MKSSHIHMPQSHVHFVFEEGAKTANISTGKNFLHCSVVLSHVCFDWKIYYNEQQ